MTRSITEAAESNSQILSRAWQRNLAGNRMKLFEYESKSLAQNLGINTPRGGLASTPDEARDIHKRIGGEVVIKAQVLVAGRGKAGGIKFGCKPEETRDRASEILSMTIKGEKVKKVLIEQKLNIKKELFGSIVLDTQACAWLSQADGTVVPVT